MKRRTQIKKWNRENREFKLSLKREKKYTIDNLFMSYEHYEGEFHWSDIYFIGTYEGRKRLFNTTIVSSLDHFSEKIDNLVDTKVNNKYPKRYDNYNLSFDKIDEKPLYKLNEFIQDKELDKEIKEYSNSIKKEILKKVNINIQSKVQAVSGYFYGVGLEIVTKEKYLNKEIVIKYVKLIQNMNIEKFDEYILDNSNINYTESDLEDMFGDARYLII